MKTSTVLKVAGVATIVAGSIQRRNKNKCGKIEPVDPKVIQCQTEIATELHERLTTLSYRFGSFSHIAWSEVLELLEDLHFFWNGLPHIGIASDFLLQKENEHFIDILTESTGDIPQTELKAHLNRAERYMEKFIEEHGEALQ